MTAFDITRTIDIKAPTEKVWAAITEPDLIAKWFGDSCEFDATPGGTGYFGWPHHGRHRVVVEHVDKPKTLVTGPGDFGFKGGVPAPSGTTTAAPNGPDRVTAKAPNVVMEGEAWLKEGKELGTSAYFGVVQNLVHSDRGTVYRHGGDPAGYQPVIKPGFCNVDNLLGSCLGPLLGDEDHALPHPGLLARQQRGKHALRQHHGLEGKQPAQEAQRPRAREQEIHDQPHHHRLPAGKHLARHA